MLKKNRLVIKQNTFLLSTVYSTSCVHSELLEIGVFIDCVAYGAIQ